MTSEISELVRYSREIALCEQSVSTKNCINRLCDALQRSSEQRDEALASIQWTDQVYPARIHGHGAQVELTWDEFNRMRRAAGLREAKRIGDEEGRAGFNHRLRVELQAATTQLSEAIDVVKRLRAILHYDEPLAAWTDEFLNRVPVSSPVTEKSNG